MAEILMGKTPEQIVQDRIPQMIADRDARKREVAQAVSAAEQAVDEAWSARVKANRNYAIALETLDEAQQASRMDGDF